MENSPLLIGITGGIGSGKSVISKIFSALGLPVYDADTRAKWLMANDPNIRGQLIELLGPESFMEQGLNRPFIARKSFNNEKILDRLNGIVHPEVSADFTRWVTLHDKSPVLLKESALIFETSSHTDLDQVILVLSPSTLRIKRVLARDLHRSKEEVEEIISRQRTADEKRLLAQFIVNNDEKNLLLPQVLSIHKTLISQVGR
ncbi:MAG: dephospho-CoA kinase [Flammeovirgaceae bacterium]|nr:dephospho-CoA kinase [Flammeovirgaceae bacterium]